MTHFMYTYKDDGVDGQELKYSLRSLDKNWVGEHGITVVGDRPTWLSPAVNYIQCQRFETDELKLYSIMTGLLAGCRELAGESLVSMDDDFLLVDPQGCVVPVRSKYPWESAFKNRTALREPGMRWYVDGLTATGRYVNQVPAPVYTELHRPFPFEADKALALLEKFEIMEPIQIPFWHTMYANFVGFGYPIPEGDDVRMSPSGSFTGRSAWASTDQKYWNTIGPRLSKMFPGKSRWEQ